MPAGTAPVLFTGDLRVTDSPALGGVDRSSTPTTPSPSSARRGD
jgi:hypothetical protein